MEKTTALKNLPQAGSSLEEKTFPTTLEKIIATQMKNPAITALTKYFPALDAKRPAFPAAAFEIFCTSS